jgi:hypothetical protein
MVSVLPFTGRQLLDISLWFEKPTLSKTESRINTGKILERVKCSFRRVKSKPSLTTATAAAFVAINLEYTLREGKEWQTGQLHALWIVL